MQGITLLFAGIASVLVLYLRPAKAFAIYVAVLLMYPTFLVVQVGTLDISAGRIVVAVLLMRCICDSKLKAKFRWCRLDSWITFFAIMSFAIPVISWRQPVMYILENRSGALLDTFAAYFVGRFCLTDREAFVTTIKWIALTLAPVAILGIVESCTGWGPYHRLKIYCPWLQVSEPTLNIRSRFYRAVGPFSHPILFGASFAMFMPLVYWLRHERGKWRKLAYILTLAAILGAASSMSSGPWMMVIFTIGFLALERFKYLVKPMIIFVIFSCFLIGIISNRPFYHVIVSKANPIGGSGWHRAKLIDCAIEDFDEWWLVGYGRRSPDWGRSLGMVWTDITNQYMMDGVQYGILGVVAICGILATSMHRMIQLYQSTRDPVLKSLCWAMGCIIGDLAISFNSAAFFGQAITLFYCIVGFAGSSRNLILPNNGINGLVDLVNAKPPYRSLNTYENRL